MRSTPTVLTEIPDGPPAPPRPPRPPPPRPPRPPPFSDAFPLASPPFACKSVLLPLQPLRASAPAKSTNPNLRISPNLIVDFSSCLFPWLVDTARGLRYGTSRDRL